MLEDYDRVLAKSIKKRNYFNSLIVKKLEYESGVYRFKSLSFITYLSPVFRRLFLQFFFQKFSTQRKKIYKKNWMKKQPRTTANISSVQHCNA